MAFIKIISLPGGNGATCTKYYYRDGPRDIQRNWIGIREIAEVPDSELAGHLKTGKVVQASPQEWAEFNASKDAPAEAPAPRRGRPPKADDDLAGILAAQR